VSEDSGGLVSWSRPGGGITGHVYMPWPQSGCLQFEEINKKEDAKIIIHHAGCCENPSVNKLVETALQILKNNFGEQYRLLGPASWHQPHWR
jgi:hypothetical protein